MTRPSFAARFRKAKKASGKTLEQLAKESGLTGKAVLYERVNNGKVADQMQWIEKLARALGVSPGWLAGWEE